MAISSPGTGSTVPVPQTVAPKPKAPAPAKPAAPTTMTPTQWATQVVSDLGIDPSKDPNAIADILAWMPHEEPTSQWWGGFGTASDPTRINPLNMTGMASQGYGPTPTTGNITSSGLGTFGTLSEAATGEAYGISHGGLSSIADALRAGVDPAQFANVINATGYAGDKYTPFTLSSASQEAAGPAVTSKVGTPTSATQNALDQTITPQLGALAANQAQQQAGSAQEQAVGLAQKNITDTQLQQQLQNTLAGLGLSGAQLGIETTAEKQQQAYQLQQYKGQQQADVLSKQGIQDAIAAQKAQYADTLKQLGLSRTEAQQQYGTGLQQQQQSSASSGTYNTGSYRQGVTQLQQTLNDTLAGLNISQSQAAYANQLAQRQEALQMSQLGLTEKSQAQAETYQQQQITNALKNLGISKQQLGLQGKEAQQAYTSGSQEAANQYAALVNQIQLGNQANTVAELPQIQQILSSLMSSGMFTG